MTKEELEAKVAEISKDIYDLTAQRTQLEKQLKNLKAELSKIKSISGKVEVIAKIAKVFAMDGFEDATTVLVSYCRGDRANCFEGFPYDDCVPCCEINMRERYNMWCQTADEDSVEEAESAIKDLIMTIDSVDDTIIPNIEEYYGGASGINDCWTGYIAITKDNKLVAFICRDDDFMLNDAKQSPTILFDFNTWKRP